MFKQDIANKNNKIAQLENLIEQENDSFLLNSHKNALELCNTELQELEKMQREYDLGTFDIYEHRYQEALKDFIRYANLHRLGRKNKEMIFLVNQWLIGKNKMQD